MIEVVGIKKRFGKVQAVDGVTFSVRPGEIVGFLGENGAGKTTTLRILAGFLAPDEGTVRIDGVNIVEEPQRAQRRLGYLPEQAPLHADMRIAEYLEWRARLKDVPSRRIATEVDQALARFRLADVARRWIGDLSKGYRQRVGLADALLGGPVALILDEPTVGLDPNQLAEVSEVLRDAARDRAVIVSSHDLRQIDALAARILILRGGKLAAAFSAPTADPIATFVVVAPADVGRAREALGDSAEILDERAGRLRARLAPDEVARRLVAASLAIRELGPDGRRLDDLFREATR